jgi:hypothetical protein
MKLKFIEPPELIAYYDRCLTEIERIKDDNSLFYRNIFG